MKQGFALNYTVRAYMNIELISRTAYISIDYSLHSISLRNLIIHNQMNYYYTDKLFKLPTCLKKRTSVLQVDLYRVFILFMHVHIVSLA